MPLGTTTNALVTLLPHEGRAGILMAVSPAAGLNGFRQMAADLRRDIAEVAKERSAIGEAVIRDGKAMTEIQRDRFLKLGAKISALEAQQAENNELLAAAEAANEADRNYRTGPVDADTLAARRGVRALGGHVDGQDGDLGALARPGGQTYAKVRSALFGHSPSLGGFDGAREFFGIVATDPSSSRLKAASQEGEGLSTGGALIPPGILAPILDSSLEGAIVFPRAQIWPMQSRERWVPAFDLEDRSAGSPHEGEIQREF